MADKYVRLIPPARPAVAPPPGVLPRPTIPVVKAVPNPFGRQPVRR